MKFNFEKKPGSKKEQEKLEKKKQEHYSAVVRSADYKAQQSKVVAPFGKEFKTGAAKSKKDYKREKPIKGKDY